MDQNVPKNGPIPAQAIIPIFVPILLCNTAIMGFLWVGRTIRTFLNHFGHVWYPYQCPKWLYFSPIPAQALIPNLRPILLCNTTNMGYFWVDNSFLTFLGHFRHVWYPYPCQKWLYFSPIPAQVDYDAFELL